MPSEKYQYLLLPPPPLPRRFLLPSASLPGPSCPSPGSLTLPPGPDPMSRAGQRPRSRQRPGPGNCARAWAALRCAPGQPIRSRRGWGSAARLLALETPASQRAAQRACPLAPTLPSSRPLPADHCGLPRAVG